MSLSEMIAMAIVELRDDGCDEPSTFDIQRMIYIIYGIDVSYEDITNRTDVG
jgi:hypothetical protein